MSSGVTGNFSIFNGDFLGSGFRRSWSGADGRTFVTSAGTVRPKWNNYTLNHVTRRSTSNQWTATLADGSIRNFTRSATPQILSGETPITKLQLEAQSKLATMVRGHSFNLAVNAAQAGQLVDMVTTNLGKLGRSILALKRGDFATAARQLGARPRSSGLKPSDVSGRWLELQYGWLPSLSDTFEAAKAYEVLTRKERVSTIHVSASDFQSFNSSQEGQYAQLDQRRRVLYTYELAEQLSAYRSLGLSDPLSVLWEIIPYSFVVDWFIPIGTYLDTLSILPTLTGRWMETQVRKQTSFIQSRWVTALPSFPNSPLTKKVEYLGQDVCRGLLINRSVGVGTLTTALPSFDASGLHGTRIWNAIALAAQRFLS